MKTNLDALNAKKKEIIEQIEDEILKIQKNNSIFDLEFLENYEKKHIINSDSLLDIHILFGNKGLDIFCKKLTGDIIIDFGLDFLKKDIVDYVLIKSTRTRLFQEIYKLNQDTEFINSVIEALNKYKKYWIELDIFSKSTDELYGYNCNYYYELYEEGYIPYSMANNTQRIYKIFNNYFGEDVMEYIYWISAGSTSLPYINKDIFKKLLIEQAIKNNRDREMFVKIIDHFLEKVNKFELEDSLDVLFYIITDIVSEWPL
jgi:hypothetical protein